jgi:hypothetical protein
MQTTMTRSIKSLISEGNPMQSCIDMCAKCVQICQECINLCLQESNPRDRMYCIKTLQDCAEICSTAVCFMSRGSGHIKDVWNVCASICESCAKECSLFSDDHCQACADTCRQCASECRNMMNI